MSDQGGAWGPAVGLVVLLWVAAAAAVAWFALLTTSGADPAGRLLAACDPEQVGRCPV